MKKTVIILGAGASAASGAPLMKDFLDKAENVKPGDGYFDAEAKKGAEDAFRIVFKGLRALRHAYAKSKIDTQNVESVFAAFEMAKLLGTLPGLEREEIACLPSAMQHVIRDTLETSVRFPYDGHYYLPPWPYNDFVKVIQKADLERLTIITFNYDIGVEYALFFNNKDTDYCVGEDRTGSLKLLKLHGSLNWFRCGACEQIAPITMRMLNNQSMFKWRPISENQCILGIGPYVNQIYHCQGKLGVLDGPVVVPPTSNKLAQHTELNYPRL